LKHARCCGCISASLDIRQPHRHPVQAPPDHANPAARCSNVAHPRSPFQTIRAAAAPETAETQRSPGNRPQTPPSRLRRADPPSRALPTRRMRRCSRTCRGAAAYRLALRVGRVGRNGKGTGRGEWPP
jgi:hypothetical protein